MFVIFGGRELARRAERVTISGEDYQEIHRDQVLTLLGLLVLAVGLRFAFDLVIRPNDIFTVRIIEKVE